jgi:hypothetical protein
MDETRACTLCGHELSPEKLAELAERAGRVEAGQAAFNERVEGKRAELAAERAAAR